MGLIEQIQQRQNNLQVTVMNLKQTVQEQNKEIERLREMSERKRFTSRQAREYIANNYQKCGETTFFNMWAKRQLFPRHINPLNGRNCFFRNEIDAAFLEVKSFEL